MALVLPRLLAPVLPTTYSPRYLLLAKAYAEHKHSGFPYHACAHCKGSAPAAPRRARTSVSVSFSGLPLSRPLRILGLVGLYPTNNLIRRQLILRPCVSRIVRSALIPYSVLASVSRGYAESKGRLLTCYRACRLSCEKTCMA